MARARDFAGTSAQDLIFRALCKEEGVPDPVAEHRFHPERRWRFDYAWPEAQVALEVEGGVWTRGRHVRGAGFTRDMEKYNAAALMGWIVLRTTPERLCSPETVGMVKRALDLRRERDAS